MSEMMISSHLRGWHCFRAFQGFPPPDGEQVPGGLKVWLLHVAEYLLAQCLVVFRQPSPLTDERQQCLSQPRILIKALSFDSPPAKFQRMGMSLHVLESILVEEASKLAYHPVTARGKDVS